ncbi:hypothetical protein BOTBODRAFT_165878 [Botryobasidium botryosum FD-172 SS1]|uniref:SMP-LTD domain-containing protein n=1 Tax=Botryobasidium botryosum (strain FD-172 SS1) TaxID=930990 RepID=A0A067LYX7_BOTB1|nr:hypothetical protein BOTBODRAFT_165878 [Botryobasidium botryosum FD-172 SS1]
MTLFSLTPTFTQGLVLGQFSILTLLYFIVRYLFLDTTSQQADSNPSSPTLVPTPLHPQKDRAAAANGGVDICLDSASRSPESAEWLSELAEQVIQVYRAEWRDHLAGSEGEEAARIHVERWANKYRGAGLLVRLDPVKIHAVDLGVGAPRLFNARAKVSNNSSSLKEIQFDITYRDTFAVSLSTALIFNYPTPSFARLPISVNLSLSLFSGVMTLTPPLPSDPNPALTLTLDPSFTLQFQMTSLLGSRAKIADIPKVHQLIEARIRHAIARRGAWKIKLPYLGSSVVVNLPEGGEGKEQPRVP